MARILYLEDDEIIGTVTREYLKIAGYDTEWILDGKEALERFIKDRNYDIVILDIMVPGIDGVKVLQEIRRIDRKVGIIMLSVLGDEKTQLETMDLLTDDYIIKPVPPVLLIKRIEAILRRISPKQNSCSEDGDNVNQASRTTPTDSATPTTLGNSATPTTPATPITPDNSATPTTPAAPSNSAQPATPTDSAGSAARLVIDEEGSRFLENGKDVGLTITEYAILEIFYKNRKKVYTRAELLDIIYDQSYYGSDRVIDTHIKNLRKKLEGNYIRTMVGLGYRWNNRVENENE